MQIVDFRLSLSVFSFSLIFILEKMMHRIRGFLEDSSRDESDNQDPNEISLDVLDHEAVKDVSVIINVEGAKKCVQQQPDHHQRQPTIKFYIFHGLFLQAMTAMSCYLLYEAYESSKTPSSNNNAWPAFCTLTTMLVVIIITPGWLGLITWRPVYFYTFIGCFIGSTVIIIFFGDPPFPHNSTGYMSLIPNIILCFVAWKLRREVTWLKEM